MPSRFQFTQTLPTSPSRAKKPDANVQDDGSHSNQQFASKPQFAFSATLKPTEHGNSLSLEQSNSDASLVNGIARPGSAGAMAHEDEMLLGPAQEGAAVVAVAHAQDMGSALMLESASRPPKRRRVFDIPSPSVPSQVARDQPKAVHFAAPRFKASSVSTAPKDTAISPRANAAHAPRTRFVLPSDASVPSPTSIPVLLPDVFSPHRRKERFVAGGWANQVRSWAIEASTGSGLATSSLHRAHSPQRTPNTNQGAVLVRVLAMYTKSGDTGPILLRGAVVDLQGNASQRANVLLARRNVGRTTTDSREQDRSRIRIGTMLHLNSPLWDVALPKTPNYDGGLWVVSASWQVA